MASYLFLHNKTHKTWWIKTTIYYFSWFCGLARQVLCSVWYQWSYSCSCFWLGLEYLRRPGSPPYGHSLLVSYPPLLSPFVLSLFCMPAYTFYMTTESPNLKVEGTRPSYSWSLGHAQHYFCHIFLVKANSKASAIQRVGNSALPLDGRIDKEYFTIFNLPQNVWE